MEVSAKLSTLKGNNRRLSEELVRTDSADKRTDVNPEQEERDSTESIPDIHTKKDRYDRSISLSEELVRIDSSFPNNYFRMY